MKTYSTFINRINVLIDGRDDSVRFRHKFDGHIHTLLITLNGTNFTVRSDSFSQILETMNDICECLNK